MQHLSWNDWPRLTGLFGLCASMLTPSLLAEEPASKTDLPPGYSRMQAGHLATRFTSQTLLPVYQKVAEASNALGQEIGGVCAATQQGAALDKARQAWRNLMAAWRVTEPISFGPAPQAQLGLKFNPPVQADKLEKLVPQVELKPEQLEGLEAQGTRGLSALEYLLWQDGAVESANQALKNPQRCAALVAITRDMQRQAQSLFSEARGLNNAMFMDRVSPRRLPAKQVQIASQFLADLVGTFSTGGNDWRSAFGKQSLTASADGLHLALFGGGADAVGLDDYLKEMDFGGLASKLDTQIAALKKQIAALPEPSRKGFTSEQLAEVKHAALVIRATLEQDVSAALALLPRKEAADPVPQP